MVSFPSTSLVGAPAVGALAFNPGFSMQTGPAAALLNFIGSSKATFVLTDRCNIRCRHCFAPAKMGELDQGILKRSLDELSGVSDIYFSGGEPFLYGGGVSEMASVLHYAANRASRVHVATNGSFLPEDEGEAIERLSQLPRNLTIILSTDLYHAEALAGQGRSVGDIFNTLKGTSEELGLGFRVFSRHPKGSGAAYYDEMMGSLGIDPSVYAEMKKTRRWQSSSVSRQNAAAKLPMEDTYPVKVVDFVRHSSVLGILGIFINQKGEVTDNSHAAYMREIPPFAILGNLRDASLFDILGRTLLKNFVEGRGVDERELRYQLGGILSVEHFSRAIDAIRSPRKPVTNDEIREMVVRPDSGVHWDIDYVVKDIFTIFGSDAARLWMSDFVSSLADALFVGDARFPKSFVLPSIIMSEGKASLGKGSAVRINSFGSAWSVVRRLAGDLSEAGMDDDEIGSYLLSPIYDGLVRNRWKIRKYDMFERESAVSMISELRDMLEIRPTLWDRFVETLLSPMD